MFIAEKQTKSVFINGVGMILVPRPPDVAYCVVRALENHHRVMVYNKVCNLLHHGLSSFFMIAHLLKTVRHADQIIVVDKGQVIQRGTHEELLRQDGIYRRFITGREQAAGWKL